MSSTLILYGAAIGAISYLFFLRSRKNSAPYPPGPTPLPILGNLLDFPTRQPWIKYSEMSKKYNSDLVHLSIFNTHIIVAHSVEAIIELTEKRSRNYSTRPEDPMVDFLAIENYTPFKVYGDEWRLQRKMLKETLKMDKISAYHDLMMERSHLALDILLDDPGNFRGHFNMLGASVTMGILFGYDIALDQTNDKYLVAAETGSRAASRLLAPDGNLVALFPILMRVPPWFPGASTQKIAAKARAASNLYREGPVAWVKRNMATGTLKDCVTSALLEKRTRDDGSVEDEKVLKDTLAGLYLAGVGTMKSTLNSFVLAMAINPTIQMKAQEEIDRVVGRERMPTFEDRASLPHVEAILRETLRWRPVAPLGCVHTAMEDDVYKGHHIPKGAFVFPSTWALSHDEVTYPDPDSFKPERFFNPDGTLNDDTFAYGFGYGRRTCSGMHMADAVLWVTMAAILATLDIKKAKDEHGAEIDIDPKAFEDGMITNPLPFRCSILPRSQEAKLLIRNAASIARGNMTPPVDA